MNLDPPAPLRPRDLALLLLASRDLRPRRRARDQQADSAGLELKRRVLEEIAAVDPEPEALEPALLHIAARLDVPSGPARAVAAIVLEEWTMACAAPEWVAQLLAEAVQAPEATSEERRRG
jgi:hypothetical protein